MITVAQLKLAVDPVEIIGAAVRLRKVGKRHVGLCPFHSEKTPSFSLSEGGLWHCFGCGKGGDILSFIELQEGVDFRAAKRRLAALAGIELDERETFDAPPLAFKLSSGEARAFDAWLTIEQHRQAALWRLCDQSEAASMAYLSGLWNETPGGLDQKAIEDAHRSLNFAHEGKQLVDERIMQLDADPSAEIEPFLRRLYGNEDFRAAVAS